MKINKTFIEKAHQFARLKKRWKALPENMILEVMDMSEVNEIVLNKVRSINLNERIREHGRKKQSYGNTDKRTI